MASATGKMRIEFGEAGELREGELEVTIVMRGTADAIVDALTKGLPEDAKRELADALVMECRRRRLEPAEAFAEPKLSEHAQAVQAEIDKGTLGNLGRLTDGGQ